MPVQREWYCKCSGKKRPLIIETFADEEAQEPSCPRCGATPSSDPKKTLSFIDKEEEPD